MDQYLVASLSKKLQIAPLNILREEAEMLILFQLGLSPLAAKTMFYGGTALRLAYNGPRFSEDLDFLLLSDASEKELETALSPALKENPFLQLEDLKEKQHTLFAQIKIRSPLLKHALPIKIEMSKRKNSIKMELRPLSSPCSPLQPLLNTITLESLETAKIRAIKNRDSSRDWFDLWYISKIQRKPFHKPKVFPFSQQEFKREMKIFLPQNYWPVLDEILKAVK